MSYSRLYHRFAAEFPAIYADDAALAAWVRLLVLADASWPLRPPLPRSVRRRPLGALVGAGLVLIDGDAYTVLGLDAERTRRRNAARNAAAMRWQSAGNATAYADAMPRREEKRLDEKSNPPNPPQAGGYRANGTNPRAVADRAKAAEAEERALRRVEANAIRLRYHRGEITEAQYDVLLADLGKEPDDLTRTPA